MEEYARNFKSLWDTVKAFRGLPGMQKGLVNGLLASPGKVVDVNNIARAEQAVAEEEIVEVVKAAMLISGVNKAQYGKLKEQLANNYLLGTDQYPNMPEKASRILGNYQGPKPSSGGYQRNEGAGLAFIQQGAQGGRGLGGGRSGEAIQGHGTAMGQGVMAGDTRRGGCETSGATPAGPSTNSLGESHCYHREGEGHWARECPLLSEE